MMAPEPHTCDPHRHPIRVLLPAAVGTHLHESLVYSAGGRATSESTSPKSCQYKFSLLLQHFTMSDWGYSPGSHQMNPETNSSLKGPSPQNTDWARSNSVTVRAEPCIAESLNKEQSCLWSG